MEAGRVIPRGVDGIHAVAICGIGVETTSPDVHGVTIVVARGGGGGGGG